MNYIFLLVTVFVIFFSKFLFKQIGIYFALRKNLFLIFIFLSQDRWQFIRISSHFFQSLFPLPRANSDLLCIWPFHNTVPSLPNSIPLEKQSTHSPKNSTLVNRSALSFLVQKSHNSLPRKNFQSHRQSHRFHFRGTLPRHSWTTARPLPESQPESLHLFTMRIRSQVQPRNDHASLSTSWNLSFSIQRFFIQKSVHLCNRRILSSFFLPFPPFFLFDRTHITRADQPRIFRTVGQKLKCSAHFRFDSFIFARLHTRGYKPVLRAFPVAGTRPCSTVKPFDFSLDTFGRFNSFYNSCFLFWGEGESLKNSLKKIF